MVTAKVCALFPSELPANILSAIFRPEQVSVSSADLNQNNSSSLRVLNASHPRYVSDIYISCQSAPGERPSDHFEEQLVGFPKVVTKLPESLAAQRCVRPTFGLIQALVMSCRQKAVEALGGVVIEVVWADPGWKVQEPLGLPQLREGIPNERITIHHVNLLPGEYLQPTGKMLVVQTPL